MTTTTPTLADFLLARIAEDEQTALQIGETTRWEDRRGEVFAVAGVSWRRVVEVDEANGVSTIAAEHIARWDPARVLVECEAKRRIVNRHRPVPRPFGEAGADCDVCAHAARWDGYMPEAWPCADLRDLATAYADHADYRDEWRP